MPRTKAEMLEVLRRFFTDNSIHYDEQKALWDILTGLRGPDNGDMTVKAHTTEIIRWHFLGFQPNSPRDIFGSMLQPDREASRAWRSTLSEREFDGPNGANSHFINHATRAFEALGLDWYDDNDKPPPEAPALCGAM